MSKSKQNDSKAEMAETAQSPQVSTGEIVLYQPEGEVRLSVCIKNETVWLTQAQMAELFQKDRTVIGRHIKNIFDEGELKPTMVCAKIAHTTPHGAIRGKTQISEVALYNLDVIISVGYRVKSIHGTRFRQWALGVLKDYMLKGYAVNQRKIATDLQIADRLQEQRLLIEKQGAEIAELKSETTKHFDEHKSRISAVEQHIDFFVKAAQTPAGGVIAPNTRFDGFVLISDLVKSAKRSVIFIDPFATVEVLKFAAMREKGVAVTIFSPRITPEFKEAVKLHNKQYPGLELETMRMIHDRFLLVDDTVYHFGASFKDMGAEFSAYSVLNFVTPEEVIEKVKDCSKGR